MPGNILKADTGFPQFGKGQSTDEKINTIMNYLYMLLEQLRYSMGNLDAKNFNPTGLEEIGGLITEPLYVQLFDPETGAVTRLNITAEGITTRLDKFGVTEFDAAKTYAKGDLVSHSGGYYRCTTAITTPGAWDSSKWEAVAEDELTAEAQQSTLTQTVNGFTLQVTDVQGNSVIGLYSNGALIGSTGTIQLNGLVKFTDLNDDQDPDKGYSLIDGGKILSQQIESCSVMASTVIGGEVIGAYVYGTNGLYGPEVISRELFSYSTPNYNFTETRIKEGRATFGMISRQTEAAFTGVDPERGTYIDQGTIKDEDLEVWGEVYADYATNDHKFYVVSYDGIPIKIDSARDISIDATLLDAPAGSGNRYPNTTAGRIFIGGRETTIGGTSYGQQVRLGGTKGEVLIYPAQELSGLSGVWEFKSDGIYYNGVKKVSV